MLSTSSSTTRACSSSFLSYVFLLFHRANGVLAKQACITRRGTKPPWAFFERKHTTGAF